MTIRPKKQIKYSAFLLLTILSCSLPTYAQFDFTKNVNLGNLHILNLHDYEKPNVKWNMSGPNQVSINEGLNNMELGLWRQAAMNFEEAIARDSTLFPAQYYRGVCLKEMFLLQDAIKCFVRAVSIDGTQPEPRLELAEIHQFARQLQLAKNEFREIIIKHPSYIKAHYAIGVLYYEDGKSDSALLKFTKCQELDPRFAPAIAGEGILQFRRYGGIPKAIELFTKAINADSSFHQSFFWRGLARLVQNEPQAALSDWSWCVNSFPGDGSMRMMRAALYVTLKRYDEAFGDLLKVVSRQNVNGFTGTVDGLQSNLSIAEATSYITAHAYGLSDTALYYLKKGFCFLLVGGEDPVEPLNESLKIEPSASAYYLLGLAYEKKQNANLAIENFSAALSLDNDIFGAYLQRADYHLKSGAWDQAKTDCKETIRLRPEFAESYKLMARIDLQRGDYPSVVADLKAYVLIDSSNYSNFLTLAHYAYNTSDYQTSLEASERAQRLIPHNFEALDIMAKSYTALKDTAKAISIYSQFKGSVLPIAHLELAQMYFLQKNWKSVEKELVLAEKNNASNLQFGSIVQCLRGRIKLEEQKNEKALGYFGKAISLWEENDEAHFYRALANNRLGRKDEALTELTPLARKSYPGASKLIIEVSK